MTEKIGEVTHYFPNIGVAVVKLDAPLKVGDQIEVKGVTTDFTQSVDSMQIDKTSINEARKGDEIGLKVKERVREGDIVNKL